MSLDDAFVTDDDTPIHNGIGAYLDMMTEDGIRADQGGRMNGRGVTAQE